MAEQSSDSRVPISGRGGRIAYIKLTPQKANIFQPILFIESAKYALSFDWAVERTNGPSAVLNVRISGSNLRTFGDWSFTNSLTGAPFGGAKWLRHEVILFSAPISYSRSTLYFAYQPAERQNASIVVENVLIESNEQQSVIPENINDPFPSAGLGSVPGIVVRQTNRTIESIGDLEASRTEWQPLTNSVVTGGIGFIIDLDSSALSHRFYRASGTFDRIEIASVPALVVNYPYPMVAVSIAIESLDSIAELKSHWSTVTNFFGKKPINSHFIVPIDTNKFYRARRALSP